MCHYLGSRFIYLNDTVKNDAQSFLHNGISTAKYTAFTFLPKFLLEQFSKSANVFFLFTACIQQIGDISPTSKLTTTIPLTAVLIATAFKEGMEDLKRHRADNVINSRRPTSIGVNLRGRDMEIEVLNICEFNSTRKRMSAILRFPDGTIKLYCKGADTVILERLDQRPGSNPNVDSTMAALEDYASEGLRTLCIAYRVISEAEYAQWSQVYDKAATTLVNRGEELDRAAELIERDLVLLGATAIEDKLQDEVPETIATLAMAGIKIWVLTGDRQETAIKIGYSCKLLTEDMNLLTINYDNFPETKKELERQLQQVRTLRATGGGTATGSQYGSSTHLQGSANPLQGGGALKAGNGENESLALIIDGRTLDFATPPRKFPDTEWHSGTLPITLQGLQHCVEYHVHRESGGTWAFLSLCGSAVPRGYWFRIDEWANATGFANVDVLAGAVPNTNRLTIRHLAFQSSFLQHVGVPDYYSRKMPIVEEDLTEAQQAQLAALAEKYGEFVPCLPPNPPNIMLGPCRVGAITQYIPALNDAQRLFMIEYSLVHVFDWIGHLWTQYPTDAPVIALKHTTGASFPRWRSSVPEFTAYIERIACKCILDSKMAPLVDVKAAMVQSPNDANDPEKFQDGGRFGKPFDPDAFDKAMSHRDSWKNTGNWTSHLQGGVVLDGLVAYEPAPRGW